MVILLCYFFFFFSSRRRHTRFDCDWSSDVCSSDLCEAPCLFAKPFVYVQRRVFMCRSACICARPSVRLQAPLHVRSEEHTSELQSQSNLVCRLLLEKKKSTCPTSVCQEMRT